VKKKTWVAVVLGLLAALPPAPAVAQQNTYALRIPFKFSIAAQTLPAGEYRVGVISPGAVQIRGIDTTASAMVVTMLVRRSPAGPLNAELLFHRYGEQYFLARVWFRDIEAGYQLYASKNERFYPRRLKVTTILLAEQ